MTHLETLRSRRSKILKEMSGLEQMRRGRWLSNSLKW